MKYRFQSTSHTENNECKEETFEGKYNFPDFDDKQVSWVEEDLHTDQLLNLA